MISKVMVNTSGSLSEGQLKPLEETDDVGATETNSVIREGLIIPEQDFVQFVQNEGMY